MAASVRGIIFDFGGVILDMRWDVCRALEEQHDLPRGSVFTTLYRCEAWQAVERGTGDREAWLTGAHRALEDIAGRGLPPLHLEWRSATGLITDNIDLIRKLRPAYRLGILSNADETLRTRLIQDLKIADLFDDVVCSAEVGLAKPDPEIYALACARLRVPAEACVFVDDHEPNVAAAARAGLRAVLYRVDRGDDLKALLAAQGVSANERED
jgi:putative hydrolase of the HAD superfamily